jgi:hypothetical protein
MNKDIYLTIIEDLKTAHQEEINRLQGKLIAHEIFDNQYNQLNTNKIIDELIYDIEMFILNSDDKYAILGCFELFDKYYFSTYLEQHINKNKSLIQELLSYCTREDLILYGIEV